MDTRNNGVVDPRTRRFWDALEERELERQRRFEARMNGIQPEQYPDVMHARPKVIRGHEKQRRR